MDNITINFLRNTNFHLLYHKFLLSTENSEKDILALLKLAILFLNKGDKYIKELGYNIILKYCNKTKEYYPLYELSLSYGYYPIVKYIENNSTEGFTNNYGFFDLYISSAIENLKTDNKFLTLQQLELKDFFEDNNNENIAVIAPTSYGKSELILSSIKDNLNFNICILVPTKALLAQTKKRIINSVHFERKRKIITHPEMYNKRDKNIIAILTQERLLRLLQNNKDLKFNLVFIDEAHNLLYNDSRNKLLSIVLLLLRGRNSFVNFKFLTPFLANVDNLNLRYTENIIKDYIVNEKIKVENYFVYDFKKDNLMKIYDQYLNKFLHLNKKKYKDDVSLILNYKGNKNIVFLNKPVDIENFAFRLSRPLQKVESVKIVKACKEISKYLHKDYNLVKYLEYGIVYHHGSVPDTIRLYIEELFNNNKDINYIITNSTLLEGVNIPADKLFLLSYLKGRKKLNPSQFKNLSGRVCRFSEIFNGTNGNMNLLEPQIFVVSSQYMPDRGNIEDSLVHWVKVDNKIDDEPENIMLENTTITKSNKEELFKIEETIANIESGIVKVADNKISKTEIGKSCFINNITEIDILKHEDEMMMVSEQMKSNGKTDKIEDVIALIINIFIPFIEENDSNNNLKRLANEKAQIFYIMLLNWKIRNASYGEMINSFIRYWKKIETNEEDTLVFVGKWGDSTRGGGFQKLWIDLKEKNDTQLINYAIVRIKEEQDFLDNNLIKFIEVLNDMGFFEKSLYNKLKFGTEDETKIILIKNGVNISLANLLLSKYIKYLNIDIKENTVNISPLLISEMNKNKENEILIFEAKYNIATEGI